jgi:hypothetical protein
VLLRDDRARWAIQFDHLLEMTNWIKDTPPVWSDKSSRHEGRGMRWDLDAGYDGALRLASEGWPEGVQQLHALAATVPNNTLVTHEYGIAGERPDVPRYLAGDPLHMVHRGRTKVPKPTMTIALNIRVSAAVGAQEAANFGAAMCALVDRLESRRVRVELLGLMATNSTSRGSKRWAMSWSIKRAEDPLDLSAVAFSYAHPAMFRRLGFAIMERSPRDMRCPGYGVDGGIKAADFVDLPEGALLIMGVDHNPGSCRTMAGALAFATTAINNAAGEPIAELEEYDA